MNRKVFDLTYKYSDVHDLYLLQTGENRPAGEVAFIMQRAIPK